MNWKFRSILGTCLIIATISLIAWWSRSTARRNAEEGYQSVSDTLADLTLIATGSLEMIGRLDLHGSGLQRPVAIAMTPDDRLLILDNEGAIFATAFAERQFGRPLRLPLARPLDLPVAMRFAAGELVIAGRSAIVRLNYPDTAAEPRRELVFDTARHVAALPGGNVLISSHGLDRPTISTGKPLQDLLASAADGLIKDQVMTEPPLLASCGDGSFVLQEPTSTDLFIVRQTSPRPERVALPEHAVTLVKRFSESRSANAAQPRRARLIASLSCTKSMVTMALQLPWPTLMLLNTATGSTTIQASQLYLPDYQPADLAIGPGLRTVYLLFISGYSQGVIVALATPQSLWARNANPSR